MLKFFKIIFQLLIITVLVLFVVKNTFIISFEINDFIYSVSSAYLFVIVVLFLLFIFLIQTFYFQTKFQFIKFRVTKKIKNKEKGYQAFVAGMLALANKDYKKAIIDSNKISRYLDQSTSLSLLLKSEIFKVEKKYDELNVTYEEMTKNEETKNLGYRGLMEQYLRSQDYHHAYIYGERLFNSNPFIEKIYETLVNILVKTNNWQQLIDITEKAYIKKIIDQKTYKDNKSIALFEIAKIKRLSEQKEAIINIELALKLRKNFPPYIKLYLDLLIESKNYNSAKKNCRKYWNLNPHPEYKSSIYNLATNLKIQPDELAKYIVGSTTENEESKILMVEASISAKKWQDARIQIKNLLDMQPKREVCILMARIEEGDSGDIQKVNSWELRSKSGASNNVWICMFSKKSQYEWTSLSLGGHFNSLEWRQPFMLNQVQLST